MSRSIAKQARSDAKAARRAPRSASPSPGSRPRVWVWWGAALLLGATLGVSSILGFQALQPAIDARLDPPRVREMPTSYYDLLAMSPDELAKVDIALMNLLCAKGLPGADNLDIPAVLKQIDEWAAKVKFETERHLYRVKDPRYAEHYANSEARLRAEFIVQVLQEDCGVRYNPERVYAPDFRDSRDMFIHGMLPGASGGTCASMPVMYVAIGRRLGYPMKLVQAKAHLFCRWGDGQERFNIEGASNGNVNYDPDEYYHTWPKPLSKADLASGVFLSSMTATQELAVFLDIRGVCCRANHRLPDARAAYAEAHRLEPRSQNTFAGLLAVCGAGPTLRHSDANPAADAWLREMMPPDPPPGMVPGPHPAPPPENPRGGG